MAWTHSEVKLGGHVLAGASVTHKPRVAGWRGPAPKSASVTGTALVKDLVVIHKMLEKGDVMGQSGVFARGVSVAITSMSLRHGDGPPRGEYASYDISVMEVRLVNDSRSASVEGTGQY